MNTLRSLLFRTLVPVSFATICVYLTYAKEGPALVPIARNLAVRRISTDKRASRQCLIS